MDYVQTLRMYPFHLIVKYLERILKFFHLVLEKMLTGCRRIFYSARKEEMPIQDSNELVVMSAFIKSVIADLTPQTGHCLRL